VDSHQGAHLVNSSGAMDEDAWGKYADWIDDYGPVDGEVVGIALFNHPDNVRHPTRWHARTYGLLAANPFGEREFPPSAEGEKQGAKVIHEGTTLSLRYRVLLHRGDPVKASVSRAYNAFLAE
jgi:hypothetical protein